MDNKFRISEKEYKEYFFTSNYYKSLGIFSRILVALKVKCYKFENTPTGWEHKSRINPYNPLSYVLAIIVIFIALFVFLYIYFKTFFGEIYRQFFYR